MAIDFDKAAERLRNWGRWGEDDQRGTINHVGPEALKRAAAEVVSGKLISLGLEFSQDGPQIPEITKRPNPQLLASDLDQIFNPANPRSRFNDDVIVMPLQSATQWDALSHVHYDGEMYNGCKASECLTARGTKKNGVHHLGSPGIMSRGVLLDIARLHGVDELPADHKISPDELNRACEKFGVTVEAGDIVVVRTGHLRTFTVRKDKTKVAGFQAGLGAECAEWLYDKSAAAVAADNIAVEFLGMESLTQEVVLPFHMLAIRDMGMPLGELFDLEALSQDCAADGRYSFLLSAPPLKVTGAFGSPINPIVLK
ncbi:cyclase family protein [Novosphingobium pentaromativorans]|uniref:Cyclase family protein n=1 Tax=Novosphingobium pentaromativorans US6-1 TaxID=1088721 RepID=G6ECG1_9SPHN|nr:cyclase family protein [Novosphingobium pentaromativorans]AIT80063.1 hypothetical protein JI59_09925 [Novosphingobium pentaromativorans US6-1]EHJ61096.1 cyclase family protein [Novosphingobium pentaromativorans US6-1]